MAKKTKKTKDSVEDQLKALHQLQVIDTKIDKIRIIRGELPLEIEDLEDLVAGLDTRLEKFETELEAINESIVGNKNTISLATAAIKKYETQLKDIKNKITPERMLKAMKSCIDNKMIVKTNIILGFPNEKLINVIQTYIFIIKMAVIGVHETAVWTFSAYPGSEIYNDLLKKNKIPHTDEYYISLMNYADPFNTVSWSNYFGKRTLQVLMQFGLVLFYGTSFFLRPIRLIKNVINIRNQTPVTRLEHVLIKAFYRKTSPNNKVHDADSEELVSPPDGGAHVPNSGVLTSER